jgi:hypothetical protein
MENMALRAAVAVALLLTWLVPGIRLSVLPSDRALVAATTEVMCLSSRASVLPAAWQTSGPLARSSTAPTLADLAAPMQRAFDKQWQTDAARIAFVVIAAAALLAVRGGRVAAPMLAIAAATLYLWAYEPHWDGYRLLLVTQSPALWWHAVSQWSWALQAERLLAPATVWFALLGAAWLLWRSRRPMPSHAMPVWQMPTLLRSFINKARA